MAATNLRWKTLRSGGSCSRGWWYWGKFRAWSNFPRYVKLSTCPNLQNWIILCFSFCLLVWSDACVLVSFLLPGQRCQLRWSKLHCKETNSLKHFFFFGYLKVLLLLKRFYLESSPARKHFAAWLHLKQCVQPRRTSQSIFEGARFRLSPTV